MFISLTQLWSRYATIVKPSFSEGLIILSYFVILQDFSIWYSTADIHLLKGQWSPKAKVYDVKPCQRFFACFNIALDSV